MDMQNSEQQSPSRLVQETLRLVVKICVVVLAIILIFTFVFRIEKAPDNSMSPSIKGGDLVFCYQFDKSFRAGDVVLITYGDQTQLRRIVATEGDTVDISEQKLIINGAVQQEQNILSETTAYESTVDFPLTLQKNEVFVLGDNRIESFDSRTYGPINIENISSKAISVFRTNNL